MSLLRTAWLVCAKDLRTEARTGEVLVTSLFFAVLVTVLTSLSFYADEITTRLIAPGVLWISITFAGVLAMGRTWSREREHDALRALLLAPVPRAGIYLGKALGTLAFMLAVELALVPLVALLYRIDLVPVLAPLVLVLLLGTVGFVAAGTLFAAMGVNTRARDLVLSVVLFPLAAPALLAGVVATRELFGGAELGEIVPWLRVLGAFDLVFVAGGLLLFEPLISD